MVSLGLGTVNDGGRTVVYEHANMAEDDIMFDIKS